MLNIRVHPTLGTVCTCPCQNKLLRDCIDAHHVTAVSWCPRARNQKELELHRFQLCHLARWGQHTCHEIETQLAKKRAVMTIGFHAELANGGKKVCTEPSEIKASFFTAKGEPSLREACEETRRSVELTKHTCTALRTIAGKSGRRSCTACSRRQGWQKNALRVKNTRMRCTLCTTHDLRGDLCPTDMPSRPSPAPRAAPLIHRR